MTGQTVLVTGGSGTFGTAFVRYALAHDAARVIVLSRGEHRQADLKRLYPDPRLECWIGDVRDAERMTEAMGVRPDIVIHAAALKRIEVCEAEPIEAHKTNVLGTLNVMRAALAAEVPRVLLISSDKACAPETVYGATKAQAEALALGLNGHRGDKPTRISVVRYGNILGSNGSFLETLMRARTTGEGVALTDPAATRFWWAIDDAVAFVGRVLDRMQGAEIWIPRLTSSTVQDLAVAIAPRSTLTVTGMRGSEKQHEAMISATEARYAWAVPDGYMLLPKQGQWWSHEPPAGAVKVPVDFRYTSNDDPLPVRYEPQSPPEGQPCVSASSV